MIKVKIKLLYPNAVIPAKATPGSMGYDVTAHQIIKNSRGLFIINDTQQFFFGKVFYGLGFAMEIPEGECAWLTPRSSINKHDMLLANSPGLLDSDYRDEIKACFYYNSFSKLYQPGDRIAQMVFYPDPEVELIQVDELAPSERKGGFGSTGR